MHPNTLGLIGLIIGPRFPNQVPTSGCLLVLCFSD